MQTTSRSPAEDAPYRNLVKAAAGGDRQAFDSLLRRHESELRSFLQRRLGPGEIDDVFQDVWLAAWTSIKAYSGRCRFKTWLYSIAVFKIRDLYRRRVRDLVDFGNHYPTENPFEGLYEQPRDDYIARRGKAMNLLRAPDIAALFKERGIPARVVPSRVLKGSYRGIIHTWWRERYDDDALFTQLVLVAGPTA